MSGRSFNHPGDSHPFIQDEFDFYLAYPAARNCKWEVWGHEPPPANMLYPVYCNISSRAEATKRATTLAAEFPSWNFYVVVEGSM